MSGIVCTLVARPWARRRVETGRVLAGVALALLTACSSGPTPEQRYQQAWKDYQAGKYRTAAVELKAVLLARADDADARELLGESYLHLGLGAQAEKELARAKRLGYGGSRLQAALLRARLLQGEHRAVLTALAGPEATRLEPAVFYLLRAEARAGLGRLERARADFAEALRHRPSLAAAHFGLARLALSSGDPREALTEVESGLRLDPKSASGWMLEGAIALRGARYAAALAAYRKALERAPDDLRANTDAAIAELLAHRPKPARPYLDAIGRLYPKAPPALLHLRALADYQQGKVDAAQADLRSAVAVDTSYAPSLYLLSYIDYRQRVYRQSQALLERFTAALPDEVPGRLLLGATYLALGEPRRALAPLDYAYSRRPGEPIAARLLANAYLMHGDLERGLRYLGRVGTGEETGTREAPNVRQALARGRFALAASYASIDPAERLLAPGDYLPDLSRSSAARLAVVTTGARALIAARPDDPTGHALLGVVAAARGETAAATRALHRALERAPRYFYASNALAAVEFAGGDTAAARTRYASVARAGGAPRRARHRAELALARIDFAAGKTAAALGRARKAYAANSSDPDAADLYGWLLVSTGAPEQGVSLIARAAGERPDDPAIAYHYAAALEKVGQPDRARRVLERALPAARPFPERADAERLLARLRRSG